MKDEEIDAVSLDFKTAVGMMRQGNQEVTDSWLALLRNVNKDGVLSSKLKQLMCVGIALATKCQSCIILHTKSAIEAGATKEELIETCGVALMMEGSGVMPYTSLVFKSYEKFSEKK